MLRRTRQYVDNLVQRAVNDALPFSESRRWWIFVLPPPCKGRFRNLDQSWVSLEFFGDGAIHREVAFVNASVVIDAR